MYVVIATALTNHAGQHTANVKFNFQKLVNDIAIYSTRLATIRPKTVSYVFY